MMMNQKTNSGQSSEVREQVVEYEVRRKDSVQWKYDPRKLIPFDQIEAVAKKIAERFSVEKILLFGSYAYGEPEEGSDVDLLIIMDHDKESNRKQMFEIARMLSPRPFPIDLVVRTPRDIDTRIPQGDWFLKDAYEKGKVLYANAP
ncbi:MAG: nucleotidyltransferase domain-containing protein [Bacteroidota bacterium]|jgi:predicted nucleotidyltransferase